MPCYSIVTNTVELNNVGDLDLLEKALKEHFGNVYRVGVNFSFRTKEGYGVQIRDGKLIGTADEETLQTIANETKQAYSRAAVNASAKRFGWIVKWSSPTKYQMIKN